MNVVPVVTGPCVAGKDQAEKTFFNRDRVTDFELRFVRAACDGSMWSFLHLSYCDVPDADGPTKRCKTVCRKAIDPGPVEYDEGRTIR